MFYEWPDSDSNAAQMDKSYDPWNDDFLWPAPNETFGFGNWFSYSTRFWEVDMEKTSEDDYFI